MTEVLCGVARAPKKKCITEGAGHENCGSIGKVIYRKYLDEFVAACLNEAEPNDAHGVAESAVTN